MSDQHSGYLFRVSNHHIDSCGPPPVIDGDAAHVYHSYFENEYGEQAIFRYDRETRRGTVAMGDVGWGTPLPVEDGVALGAFLGPVEQHWLLACWAAATGTQMSEAMRRAQIRADEYAGSLMTKIREQIDNQDR